MTFYYSFRPGQTLLDSPTQDLKTWESIYKFISYGVSMVDRTGNFTQPIQTKLYAGCCLPSLTSQSLSYRDCCNSRAQEIWQKSIALQKPLGLMWSGGIDSTRLVVSFLQNFKLSELKDRTKIITSQDAVHENPEFFKKYILPNFEIVNSENIPYLFDGSMLLVTGELNDQLFGSDLLRNYLVYSPTEYKESFSKDNIFNYINRYIDNDFVANILTNDIANSATSYGIQLEKNADWFWWYNFCFKWQNVWMRLMYVVAPRFRLNFSEQFVKDNICHFYDTKDFQLWSINSPEHRQFNKWNDYKLEAKKQIFEFDKNQDYFQFKTKRGSLQTIYYQRLAAVAIDENFNIIDSNNFKDWYLSNNKFVKNLA